MFPSRLLRASGTVLAGLLLFTGPVVSAQTKSSKAPPTASAGTSAASSALSASPAGTGALPQSASRDEQDKAIAVAAYKAGAELAKKRQWQASYPLFLEAWKRLKHWQIALNLGMVEVEIGKFHAAGQHLSFALGAPDLPAPDRERISGLIVKAREEQGTISISASAEVAARVWVDDELVGTTPFGATMSADPGEHRVEVRLGGQRVGETVLVKKGETRSVALKLPTPPIDSAAPSGPAVSTSGVASGNPESAPSVGEGPNMPALVALVGLTVVGATIGTGLWVAADGKGAEARRVQDELDDAHGAGSLYCDTNEHDLLCASVSGSLASQDALQSGAGIAWVGAGLALMGAAAVWVLTDRSPAKTTTLVVPTFGTGHAGLAVTGSW